MLCIQFLLPMLVPSHSPDPNVVAATWYIDEQQYYKKYFAEVNKTIDIDLSQPFRIRTTDEE
ncbi:MAG TPA: hypothetical protein VKX46_00570 [Ktedonobacteraceae bacterium]|nr:hypothetical protein [Ktedonobacteraceae bacterium]